MENIIDYYWKENKGMFVKLAEDNKDYFVFVCFDDKDYDKKEISLLINKTIYDKNNNKDDFWFILEKLWNYNVNRYIKEKIKENFIANGFKIDCE